MSTFWSLRWWQEQVTFCWNNECVCLVQDKNVEFVFIKLAYWNNSPQIYPVKDLLLYSWHIILSWLLDNQSLILLLNVAYLAERQQTQSTNLIVFGLTQSTTLIITQKKCSALYLQSNLVTSTNKCILEIQNMTTQCIPMHILSCTYCVRSSSGNI